MQRQFNVRKISLICYKISERKLLKILSLLPNLEEVVLDFILEKTSKYPQQRLSNLNRLRSLQCRAQVASIIFELPDDTLTSLSFEFMFIDPPPPLQTMKAIFERQRNINHFTINPVDTTATELPSLETLRLIRSNEYQGASVRLHLAETLRNQNQITSLTIQNILSKEEFLLICSLRSLEYLEIELEGVYDATLRSLNRLYNLKTLKLVSYSSKSKFKFLKLPLLRDLKLVFINDNTNVEVNMEQFPTSFPNLRRLQIMCNLPFFDAATLPVLLKNDKIVKLDVLVGLDSNEKAAMTPMCRDKLREVRLGHNYSAKALNYIIESAPNLEKLFTGIDNLDVLQKILMNFQKLTHLKIYSQNGISFGSDAFIQLLQKHGKNLTHLACETDEYIFDDEAFSKLSCAFGTQFSTIQYHLWCPLIMKNVPWNVETFPVFSV